MDDAIEREDIDAILSGIFSLNVTLSSINAKLEALLIWLDLGGDDEEEEEEDPLAPDS